MKTCINCREFERFAENVGFCHRYGFEVWLSLARKAAVCRDFELHHEVPSGRLVPVKSRGRVQGK